MESYVSGVCNIGPQEIAARRRSGWIGLGLTIVLWVVFVVFRVPAPWRLTLFFPASASATGFLQAVLRFCAGFGMRGVFNFGVVGQTQNVPNDGARRRDRRRALRIAAYSLLIGLVVGLVGFATG